MKELLQRFCSSDETFRLSEPWREGEYAVASDGHIAIRVPGIPEIVRPRPFDFDLPWEPTAPGEWVGLPEYVLPDMIKCDRCRGTGRVAICPECDGDGCLDFENSFHSYQVDCDTCRGEGAVSGADQPCSTCDGNGKYYENTLIEVLFYGRKLNALLLEEIKGLPAIRIFSAPTKENYFHFSFAGGVGIFMGLRDEEEEMKG